MHEHKWLNGMVDPKKPGKRKAPAREGLVCACGLVAVAPTRKSRLKWEQKMRAGSVKAADASAARLAFSGGMR